MDPRVRELIELMDGGLSGAMSMDELAPMLGLSASRLSHMFKAETGESPGHYLKSVRIHKSQALLETTHLSVKEIMVRVGIRDASHFVRDFQKACGRTPARYRAQYLAAKPRSEPGNARFSAPAAESANR
jgi:AraC family transcriptional regulator of arabinose operon